MSTDKVPAALDYNSLVKDAEEVQFSSNPHDYIVMQERLIQAVRELCEVIAAYDEAFPKAEQENAELRREIAHIEPGAAGVECLCRVCALRAEITDLKAALVEARGDTYPQPKQGWQCFYCGEWFTSYKSAKNHFDGDAAAEARSELHRQV